MEPQTEDPRLIKEYLLGVAPPDVQEQIEGRLLIDQDYGETVAAAQNELLDDYVRGKMPAAERLGFKEHFLSTPERLEKFRFAQALDKYVRAEAPRYTRGRWWRLAPLPSQSLALKVARPVALLLLVTAGLLAWQGVRYWRTPLPARPLPAGGDVQQELVLLNRQQYPDAPLPEATAAEPVLTLKPLHLRGDKGARRVDLSGAGQSVQLRLELVADKYASYSATLQSVTTGREIFTIGGLKSRGLNGGRLVSINIPAKMVPPDDYLLKLLGTNVDQTSDTVGSYSFQVAEQK
jgi:hypothetical protein